ncbi:MAG: tetratricopeptide repeat protein [Planctomycetes bacterium]|nr:tetratricopeptide repeat protein [Planctomycetota bacterium]
MKQLGPYRILDELGRGGMGVVFRAQDTRDARVVALKTLPSVGADLELLERFRREATVLRGISHANLVRVLDLSLEPPLPYAVFEYVEGETLKQRVRREGPLPWELAVRVLGEVAAGLAEAHARGLLHRDVKPANVLLGAGGAKLADFGLVKDFSQESLTQSGAIVGTPSYMAPEQIQGSKTVDVRIDVYGLAATLYFALTGRPPFKGPTQVATLTAVLGDPAPTPGRAVAGLPPWLDALCQQGLAKERAERPPSALAFRAALRGGAPLRQTRPAWLLPGVASLSLLAGLGACALWLGSTRRRAGTPPPAAHADPLAATANAVQALIDKAKLKLRNEDCEGARADLTRALALDPTCAQAFGDRAGTYVSQGVRDENSQQHEAQVLADCARALELDPTYVDAYVQRGLFYSRTGRPEQARQELSRALEIDPRYRDAYATRAFIATEAGRYAEALLDYDRAIELDPSKPATYVNRGFTKFALGRADDALGDLALALSLDSNYSQAYEVRGMIHEDLGQLANALADLGSALEINPDNVSARAKRARLYTQQGDYARALEDYDGCVARNPTRASALRGRALLGVKLGDFAGALRDSERALELDPQRAASHATQAWILCHLERYAEANRACGQAFDLSREDALTWASLGLVRASQARFDSAVEAFDQALRIEPDSADYAALRARCLELGAQQR